MSLIYYSAGQRIIHWNPIHNFVSWPKHKMPFVFVKVFWRQCCWWQDSFPRGQFLNNCLKILLLFYHSPHFPSVTHFSFGARLSRVFRHLITAEIKGGWVPKQSLYLGQDHCLCSRADPFKVTTVTGCPPGSRHTTYSLEPACPAQVSPHSS